MTTRLGVKWKGAGKWGRDCGEWTMLRQTSSGDSSSATTRLPCSKLCRPSATLAKAASSCNGRQRQTTLAREAPQSGASARHFLSIQWSWFNRTSWSSGPTPWRLHVAACRYCSPCLVASPCGGIRVGLLRRVANDQYKYTAHSPPALDQLLIFSLSSPHPLQASSLLCLHTLSLCLVKSGPHR